MIGRTVRIYVMAIMSMGMVGGSFVEACQICVPLRTESEADKLLSAQTVVLAREHPEKPYSYGAVRVLKGRCDQDENMALLLNTSLRRLLLADPELHVLLAKVGDGDRAEWQLLGTTKNGAYFKVVCDILKHAQEWKKNPDARWKYFASYLGHEDEPLHKLAHIELNRAPYAVIKKLGKSGVIPLDDIRVFLADPQYIEWHALYILLLAQSENPQDRAYIEKSFHSAKKFGIATLLRARTTAMIEVQGEAALDLMDAHYLKNKFRKQAEVTAVIHALYDFDGDPILRDRVRQSKELAQKNHPKAWRQATMAQHAVE